MTGIAATPDNQIPEEVRDSLIISLFLEMEFIWNCGLIAVTDTITNHHVLTNQNCFKSLEYELYNAYGLNWPKDI